MTFLAAALTWFITIPTMESGEVTESDPARLMISKVVCENFKSYAGVKELGPFHKVILKYI